MMLGIALGGFAKGFDRGMALGEKIRATRKATKEQDAISGIQEQGKQEFDQGVKQGTYKEADFDSFMADHIIPKMKLTYLQNGEIDKAEAVDKWAESTTEKKGNRLYGSALSKLNMGDINGALEDVTKASKMKGYLPEGYTFDGYREIVQNGQVIGYYMDYTTPDGKKSQPVPKDQVANAVAGIFSPETRFEELQAQQAKAAEGTAATKKELFTYEEKKKIDKQYDTDKTAKDYEKIYNSKYDEMAKGDLHWGKYTDAEKDQKVREALGLAKSYGAEQATPTAPATSDQQPAPSAPADQPPADQPPAPGITPPAAPEGGGDQAAAPAPGVDQTTTQSVAQPTDRQPAAAPRPAPTQASPRDQALANAEIQVKQGVNPVKVASQLVQAGIQPAYFPPGVTQALRRAPVQGIY